MGLDLWVLAGKRRALPVLGGSKINVREITLEKVEGYLCFN